MTFYSEIEKLFPYLKSVRKLKNFLSFDIEIPNTWKLPKKYLVEGKTVEQDKTQQSTRLFSFLAEFNEKEIDKTLSNLNSIIDFNKEIEEKEKLFVNKVKELKELFEKQNLDNLQKLEFDIKEFNLSINENGDGETNKLVQE